jgi:agmatine deiminase
MPEPIIGPNGRLPASYANFYIGNRSVIVPVFGQGNRDRAALEVIRSAFPSHRVVGVDCAAMVHGMGAVHCCSQQQPAR